MSLHEYVVLFYLTVCIFRIFSPDFHKGYDGLSVEQRREIFGHDDVEDRDMEEIKSYIDGEDLTDYDVEAVVDEDQLFG